jgi:nitrite reductase (NADH) small subunit
MDSQSTVKVLSQEEKTKLGREDSGQYLRYMAGFVGFTQDDASVIRETGLIVEKHLPYIVARFYTHLLDYPPTREHFVNKEGKVDQDYLLLRMHHLTNFWRRTSAGIIDDDYARYVDYVGRAHTSHGADPSIYIAERYVIGQVGFMQHAIGTAITKELHEIDPDLEVRALKAWNLLMMVILEMLSRAYSDERVQETHRQPGRINDQAVFDLAVETYEHGLGLQRPTELKDVEICAENEIPDGERKIVQVNDQSIGIFHHHGSWYALSNSCLHRGGPVCTGSLEGDVITCPWHGFQYDITTGKFLVDPSAKLPLFPVIIKDGRIHLRVAANSRQRYDLSFQEESQIPPKKALNENEFLIDEIDSGIMQLVSLSGQLVTVYNVHGKYYATQDSCPHAAGPLHEGKLDGTTIICPWHRSRFDVTDGRLISGPADKPLKIYKVIVDGNIGRVE